MKLSQIVLHTLELYFLPLETQLINKLASYMTDQKVFVIKIFYTSGGSCDSVVRQYRRELSVRVDHRDTIYLIIKQSEETGSVCVIYVRRDVSIGHLFVRKKLSVQHGR